MRKHCGASASLSLCPPLRRHFAFRREFYNFATFAILRGVCRYDFNQLTCVGAVSFPQALWGATKQTNRYEATLSIHILCGGHGGHVCVHARAAAFLQKARSVRHAQQPQSAYQPHSPSGRHALCSCHACRNVCGGRAFHLAGRRLLLARVLLRADVRGFDYGVHHRAD